MNDAERRELEQLLRDALHQEAARIQPAGDGLTRIRQRVASRSRVRSWLRPGVGVVAAVCAAVAVATVTPMYLRGGGRQAEIGAQVLDASPQTTTARVDALSATPSPAATAPSSTSVSSRSIPTAGGPGTELPDMVAIWPYGSRHEGSRRADVDVRQHPELTDPQRAAVRFVQSYVGLGDTLVPDGSARLDAGIGVTVSRTADDGSRHPVSLVYLVRVRQSDDSPYVVVEARPVAAKGQPAMTLDAGPLRGIAPVPVTGTYVDPPGSAVEAVKVQLREPGGDEVFASSSPGITPDGGSPPNMVWTASLTPIRALRSTTGAVAAWTVDADNHVLAFVAEATG